MRQSKWSDDWCGEHPEFPAYVASLKAAATEFRDQPFAVIRHQVDQLDQMRKTGKWIAEQESILEDLKRILEKKPC